MGSILTSLVQVLSFYLRYSPQKVTLRRLTAWLRQYPRGSRLKLFQLLGYVHFISAAKTDEHLLRGNEEILRRLSDDGIGPENIIYVSLDSAGSSSGVMLNMVRDRQNLERLRSKFVHANEGDKLTELTNQLNVGAIVYVDDFSGTGKQFRDNRDPAAQFISGNFSEFFLLACICEESIEKLNEVGVVPVAGVIHHIDSRPLHDESTLLRSADKDKLVRLCSKLNPRYGRGFKGLASMVVLDRNAPNTTPLILRGSLGQDPYKGIFPRWDDM